MYLILFLIYYIYKNNFKITIFYIFHVCIKNNETIIEAKVVDLLITDVI